MPLRIKTSENSEKVINQASKASGKSKSTIMIEAIERSPGLASQRAAKVKKLAGWMSHDEAVQFRESLKIFEEVAL